MCHIKDDLNINNGNNLVLSIIIPVHNGAQYIGQCLDALLTQSYAIDEVVVVNDHSTDETCSISMRYVDANSQIVYCESEEYGVSAARNFGLKHASGNLIGFCDADDIENSCMCEVVKQHFNNYPDTKLLITGYEKVYGKDGNKSSQIYRCKRSGEWTKEKAAAHAIYNDNILGSVCNKFFRTVLLEDIKFDENFILCEDMDFVLKAIDRCKNHEVYVLKKITYQYVINNNSVTNRKSELFDRKSNELRYNIAFLKMAERKYASKNIRKYLHYKVFEFSLNVISYYDLKQEQEISLKRCVRENLFYFLSLFWISPVNNFKYLIKLSFHIKNKKPFMW